MNLAKQIAEVISTIPGVIGTWLTPDDSPEIQARQMIALAGLDPDELMPSVLYQTRILGRPMDQITVLVIKRALGIPQRHNNPLAPESDAP
ncbi:MAG: hypothetical protein ABIP33_06380 [Pseudolysinimonas sp.]